MVRGAISEDENMLCGPWSGAARTLCINAGTVHTHMRACDMMPACRDARRVSGVPWMR